MSENASFNQMMNNSDFDMSDKDNIINKLKTQIFDLEQNAKDYSVLQTKCKKLANETSLNEEKMRLEYELKQKTESSDKIIIELQSEKENLQNALNEKLITNKTLFNDNNNLFSSLEAKNQEVEDLKEALAERDEIILQLQEEKHNFELIINELEENKKTNEINLQKMNNDLDNYNRTCIEQENEIKEFTNEKKSIIDKLNSMNFDNKNLTQKLKSTVENLNSTVVQLNEANKTILRLDDDLNQTEKELTRIKNDLNSTNSALDNEKRLREEYQDKANRLELTLKGKMNDIKNMNNEIINLNTTIDSYNKDKLKTNNDINKYKEHIMFLTETNQNIKIGKRTYKVKRGASSEIYVDDYKEDVYAEYLYLTDKFAIFTVDGQYIESISYALSENGPAVVNDNTCQMGNFKIIDGYLYATGSEESINEDYGSYWNDGKVIIKYITY